MRATATNEYAEGGDQVMEEFHYYPFGMRTEGGYFRRLRHWPAKEDAHQYNGKELYRDIGLDLMPYGARWYDPAGAGAKDGHEGHLVKGRTDNTSSAMSMAMTILPASAGVKR